MLLSRNGLALVAAAVALIGGCASAASPTASRTESVATASHQARSASPAGSVSTARPVQSTAPVWTDLEFPGDGAGLASVSDLILTDDPWLAVGSLRANLCRDAAVWTASPGEGWVIDTNVMRLGLDHEFPCSDNDLDQRILAVERFGEGYAALGTEGPGPVRSTLWLSDDGSSWGVYDGADRGLDGVAYGLSERDGLLVAAGTALDGAVPRVWWSMDGERWQGADLPGVDAPATAAMGITATSDGFVAVGSRDLAGDTDPVVWTSPDGRAWQRAQEQGLAEPGDQNIFDVVEAATGLMAVGTSALDDDWDAAVWTSETGRRWQRVPHDEAVLGGSGIVTMSSVASDGSTLIAVGGEGVPRTTTKVGSSRPRIWTSADGLSWDSIALDEALGSEPVIGLYRVFVLGDRLLLLGSRGSGAPDTIQDDVSVLWEGSLDAVLGPSP